MSLRMSLRRKSSNWTGKYLHGPKRMLIEALIFCFCEVVSVLPMPVVLGRSSGIGTEFGLTGRDLEASDNCRKTG